MSENPTEKKPWHEMTPAEKVEELLPLATKNMTPQQRSNFATMVMERLVQKQHERRPAALPPKENPQP